MNDADLIARVYPGPDDQGTRYAATSIEASSFYVPPLHQKPKQEVQYGRDDRETTEPPDEPGDRKASVYDGKPCIEIKFSKVPRSSHGVLFGCSNKCDVILPNLKGPSNYHFGLTFDEQNRFIVKDLESGIGTEVTYNDKGKGTRREFNWIVGGDENAHRQENIIIKVDDHIQFQVIAAEHDIKSQSYIDNVKKFRQGTATAEGLVEDLGIFRSDTEFPTGAHTPGKGPIYVKKKIGKGGFGVAIHCWNVSTGEESVVKRPSMEVIKKVAKYDKDWKRWKEEAENMRKLSHKHIVKLLNVTYDPYPELELEYVPGGPLSKLKNITVPESVLVLTQCLSALAYLHESQLAHRDISPDNILVRSREPFHVILADFGLSKNAAELRTQCGTTPYAAPEIFEDSSIKRYSAAVDIWSLGVVTCKILRILPSYSEHVAHVEQNVTKMTWCSMVVDSLGQLYRRRPDSLKGFLLASMLVMAPEGRNSARGCYRRVKDLPNLIITNEACDRISDVLWRHASIVYSGDTNAGDTNVDDQSTIRLGRLPVADASDTDNDEQSTDGISSTDLSSGDYETRRRSAAPPPSSRRVETRSTMKRPTAGMVPESPSSKRRGRVSISQSRGYPGAHMLDTGVDQETAEVAALLGDLKNGVYRCDHLPDLPSERIPSWHPWDPVEEKSVTWNSSTGWVYHDDIAHAAAETHDFVGSRSCSRNSHETRQYGRTKDMACRGSPVLPGSENVDSDSCQHPTAEFHPAHQQDHVSKGATRIAESHVMLINHGDINASFVQLPAGTSFRPLDTVLPLVPSARNSISQASHLSTREVFENSELWWMVIRRQRVSMRKSDHHLRVSEILNVSELTKKEGKTFRDKWLKKARAWLPFEEGVFLCQSLGLAAELQPLLFSIDTEQPNPRDNPLFRMPGYEFLVIGAYTISYLSSKQMVNATNLVQLSGKRRKCLTEFLRNNPHITTEEHTVAACGSMHGIYLVHDDAETLCVSLGLRSSLIGRLLSVMAIDGSGMAKRIPTAEASEDMTCLSNHIINPTNERADSNGLPFLDSECKSSSSNGTLTTQENRKFEGHTRGAVGSLTSVGISDVVNSELWEPRALPQPVPTSVSGAKRNEVARVGDLEQPIVIHSDTSPRQDSIQRGGPSLTEAKRKRFQPEQVAKLEALFQTNQTPTEKELEHVAQDATLTERQVKSWFANRRLTEKNRINFGPLHLRPGYKEPARKKAGRRRC